MAYLHAAANGLWSAAATWGVCTAVSTSLLDSQLNNTALTTSFVSSQAFTPGALTLDGIAVKVASRTGTPVGTMEVRLAQAGVAVAGTTVAVNITDIPQNIGGAANTNIGCSVGWLFFKFAAPVTLVAATAYTLQARTTNATQVNLFRDGTASNWSRLLRTTTTAAPGAGDSLFIGGEWTAAATMTARVVTYDLTAATDFGTASTSIASVGVSKGGTLQAQTSASTAYIFRLSGLLQNWLEGSVTLGTVGTPVPRSSTFLLEFDCAADGDFGFINFGTWETAGESRSSGKLVVFTRLTADAAATDTSLTVADDTGWLSGDNIAIAGTRRAANDAELRVLNGNAGASSIAITAGMTAARDGDVANKTQADVVLLTRNVTITTVSTSFYAYTMIREGSLTSRWTEWRRIGTGTAGKESFSILAGTVLAMTFCSFWESRDDGFSMPATTSDPVTLTLTDCVAYDVANATAGYFILAGGTTRHTLTLIRVVAIAKASHVTQGFFSAGLGATVVWEFVRVSGFAAYTFLSTGGAPATNVSMSDCEVYNSASGGGAAQHVLITTDSVSVRITRCLFWRNQLPGAGVNIGSIDARFTDCEFWGNAGSNITLADAEVEFQNCTFEGDTGFTTATNISMTLGTANAGRYVFQGCRLSQVVGERIAASTQDFALPTANRFELLLSGTPTGASPVFGGTPIAGSIIAQQRADDAADIHTWRRYEFGQIDIETGTTGVASPSMKLTPESALRRFESTRMGKAVSLGDQPTFSVSVRKNGAYNGAAPRLILKANGAIGVNKDVVLDTLSVGADTWEVLTGQLPVAAEEDGVAHVLVDCDGTAGAVFVDDFAAT